MELNAISLFSSSGIGDLGLKANNIKTVIACEINKDRMNLFEENFVGTKCFNGDIWELEDEIISYYNQNYDKAPYLILATPPCQGMSPNGMGKMLSDYRRGVRPKFDERNRLIIPAIRIIKKLKPEWVVLENVANMGNTMILDENEELINIIDYIKKELGSDYVGLPEVIDCANYGIPQHRKRLLTVLTCTEQGKIEFTSQGSLIPKSTHGQEKTLFNEKWVSLRDAIGNLPELRAVKGQNINKEQNPLHKVPLLDEKKLFWVDNTPEGQTAFNNQCVNEECGYSGNPIHGASHDEKGINKFHSNTPLYCEKCGSILPRPWVDDKATGEKRLMKGFVSAYKRMKWDEPASTLTQNFQYACSDNKLHPSQGRVLSIYEGLILQSISEYEFSFYIGGKLVSDSLIRDSIGESVPPKIIDMVCKHINKIMQK